MLLDILYQISFVVGLVHVLFFLYKLLDALFLKKLITPSRLGQYKVKDAWCVITGATDGIGKEFVVALGKMGWNVALVSRNREKLEAVAKGMGSGVKTSVHVLDFSTAKPEDFDKLALELNALGGPITLLINNVGMTHEMPEKFLDTDPQTMRHINSLNITSTIEMTRIILPKMVERRNGLVVNLSTIASTVPMPMLATYSASKAYVNTLTQALQVEYQDKGIRFEVLTPYFIETKLSKMRKSFTTPTPRAYVTEVLTTLGGKVGPHAGFVIHDVLQIVLQCIPYSISLPLLLKQHQDVRTRVIRKKEREQQNIK